MSAKKPTQAKTSKSNDYGNASAYVSKPAGSILDSNIVLYATTGIIILGIIGYFGWMNYQDRRAENVRIEHLKQAGLVLDKVKKSLDTSGIGVQTKRFAYCWRTSEKFSEGQRYCSQQLIVFAKGRDKATQEDEVTTIVGKVSSRFNSGKVNTDFIREPKQIQSGSFVISKFSESKTRCGGEVSAYDPGSLQEDISGGYYVDIICEAPIDFAGDIYRPGDNISALNFLEGYQAQP